MSIRIIAEAGVNHNGSLVLAKQLALTASVSIALRLIWSNGTG